MPVFLHVTLEVEASGLSRFMATMTEALPVLEAAGWRLAGAFVQRTGRLNTVIDLWELDDFNHYERGIRALTGHADFPRIAAALAETVRNETIVFADKAPYMR